MYRRPRDFEEAIVLLRKLEQARVELSEDQAKVQDTIRRLFEIHWFEDAMRPLYENNLVVQIVMNSIVPMLQEIILDPAALKDAMAATGESKRAHATLECATLHETLARAAASVATREVDPAFARMAASMLLYATDARVQAGIVCMFSCMKMARVALRLVLRRIVDALEKDTRIEQTSDVPIEAMSF